MTLDLLLRRLISIISAAKQQPFDIKRSRDLYRDVAALGGACPGLYRWTICTPPTSMCAHFTAQFAHRGDIIQAPELLQAIKRCIPSELLRVLHGLVANTLNAPKGETSYISSAHRTDIALQCAKRCMDIRPSLSFDEVVAFIERFDSLDIFTLSIGKLLFDELFHRSWYLIEEARLDDLHRMLAFVFKYQKLLGRATVQSYLEGAAERVVDIVGDFSKSCESKELGEEGRKVKSRVIEIENFLRSHGWEHKQLCEASTFVQAQCKI